MLEERPERRKDLDHHWKGGKGNLAALQMLAKQQYDLEDKYRTLSWQKYRKTLESAVLKNLTTCLTPLEKLMQTWMMDLTAELEKVWPSIIDDLSLYLEGTPGGIILRLIPPEEVALITIQMTLHRTLAGEMHKFKKVGPVLSGSTASLAVAIGRQLNVRAAQLYGKRRKRELAKTAKLEGKEALAELENVKKMDALMKAKGAKRNWEHERSVLRAMTDSNENLGTHVHAKLGGHLINLLLTHAMTEVDGKSVPAFAHCIHHEKKRSLGLIEVHPTLLDKVTHKCDHHHLVVDCPPPMVIPPLPWTGVKSGGYLSYAEWFVRVRGKPFRDELCEADKENKLGTIFEGLNALGATAWRINLPLYRALKELWERGPEDKYRELWKAVKLPAPKPVRVSPPRKGFRLIRERGQLIVGGGGFTPWEKRQQNVQKREVAKYNSEQLSLRSYLLYKLSIAEEFQKYPRLYYPHNLDFRGRAYPIHPFLNHMGDDLSRGLLYFADGQPLGSEGLQWLQIHLANLFGLNKMSFEERLHFAEENRSSILASAADPLGTRPENRWWATAEKPWQALATCLEIRDALASLNPSKFVSRLPVHMDGTCNGLQHYAALGRDLDGGRSVNLLPSSQPHDVYSDVGNRVREVVTKDAEDGHPLALQLLKQGGVDRKLVKQTVMTSVYGVTFIGARDQVENRLLERGWAREGQQKVPVYVAKLIFAALDKSFQEARTIMSWLALCAKAVAKRNTPVRWTTPLGLPVAQPYVEPNQIVVHTPLQAFRLNIAEIDKPMKVESRDQISAFPPNYIHSLDSSHMMMTAVECRRQGVAFAGVHDSFWTHAATVEKLNKILREQFVKLHSAPLLDNLVEDIKKKCPEAARNLPPVPPLGNLRLEDVKDSVYFFN